MMNSKRLSTRVGRTLVVSFFVLSWTAADASVLCSSRLGHLRLRERCQRHEIHVDLRDLADAAPDPVPLADWPTTSQSSAFAGLESAASAPDATMINVAPCRLVDTRPGGPSAVVGDDIGALADFEIRTYTLTGLCGVPAGATALSINLAVVPGVAGGFASVGPTGSIAPFPPGPSFASINFVGSSPPLSNSLIVPLDDAGRIDVYAARAADVIIDTNGYFQPKDAGTNVFFLPGTGTGLENGAALSAVVGEVNALPLGTRSTIELGPGVFDLDATALNIIRPVSLVGADQALTSILCACVSDAVVFSADSAGSSIRHVRVENTMNSLNSHALRFSASGGSAASHVDIRTTGGAGIYLSSAPNIALTHVTVDAAGLAVFGSGTGSSAVVRSSTLSSVNREVTLVLTANSLTIENSTLETADPLEPVIDTQSGGAVLVRHSRLTSAGSSYIAGTGGTFSMTQSFVDAATISYAGTATCTATAGPTTFDATTCP